MKSKGIIYKVTHNPSRQSYIGATTKSVNERRMDHIQRANRGETGKLQEAIATYGPEAFNWVQVDTAITTDELAQKEKDYVIKYDSKENGYNSDAGGGIQKTVYQYSIEDGSLIAKYDCLQNAGNAVNATKQNISMACLGVNKTCKGYRWSYSTSSSTSPKNLEDERRKRVIQFDMYDKVIAKYKSIAEASRVTGINKCSIAKVCRLERKQAGGYCWRYI